MNIDDINVGDILWHDGVVGSEVKVLDVDKQTNIITAEWSGVKYAFDVQRWVNGKYVKKVAAPTTVSTVASAAAKQQQQGLGGIWYYAGNAQPTIVQGIVNLGAAPAPAKTRRQVSHNGKNWVDYRHLLDADDFECYAHRREV